MQIKKVSPSGGDLAGTYCFKLALVYKQALNMAWRLHRLCVINANPGYALVTNKREMILVAEIKNTFSVSR
ncbi:hypothetical protein DIU31_008125 [Mucilaginibacter rubeus]|uniref:Uncharacterized protein n=1 Tax=Mucilaginibacter rubeus TaxID=2027860 RepID=A0AAE6MHD6_9SPHI|nr:MULTISPECIES: hypothetical protein [Mucilaginibacter]QEM03485.1 hypothetical protein DIU31_008125 [Mucilaginibacter rubeus]QTE47750.1 hypothetical protein J3L21_19530 [Mucilaginibacter rubeus]QTE59141.1 hypothetical protein J3L23_11190 [Mucilaginibacter rubeus]QTF60157.1 hypothetical protein J3L20_22305 [Mucilaginibacter rubeus]